MANELVSAFAILLVLGSVLLLFGPLLYRLARRGMWALGFIVLIPAFLAASTGYNLVGLSFDDPMILAPVVAMVFVGRVVSPTMMFHMARERLYRAAAWGTARSLAFLGFLAYGFYVGYVALVAPDGGSGDPILATEKIAMAGGTAFIFLRFFFKAVPKGSHSMTIAWGAAIFFSLAFALIAPYAFPEYHALYSISGVMGWLIGAAVIARSP